MNTTTTPPRASTSAPGIPARLRNWWGMVGVVVELELRQRLRTTRWKVTLFAAFAVISLVVLGSLYLSVAAFDGTYRGWASELYTLLMGVLLFLGIVVAPTLAATTINGDRKDATLAVVQDTAITNWQLALGKLIGNWAAGMALAGVAIPYLVWGIVESDYGIGRGLLGLFLLATLFACYAGIGLGFSAITARPAGSAVLTQATVFFLILGLPLLFGLLVPTVSQSYSVIRTETRVTDTSNANPTWECYEVRRDEEFHHYERIWWLFAPNPFVLVSDAVAPRPEPVYPYSDDGVAASISSTLSAIRSGPEVRDSRCTEQGAVYIPDTGRDPNSPRALERAREVEHMGRSWYVGAAFYLALGALGYIVAARRLRVPAGKLARGTRVA